MRLNWGLILGLAFCVACWVWAASALAATPEVKLFQSVTRQVNRAHVYGSPLPADWTDRAFDCENYAFAKRDALVARGVSLDRMQVRAVWLGRTSLHAVLVIDGVHALDSLSPWVERAASYRFVHTLPMIDPTR